MKILHIDTGLLWRGGQRQAISLHNSLINTKLDSFFLMNSKGELNNIAKKNKYKNIIPFNYFGELSIKSKKEIKSVYDSICPDIIHCHDSHSLSLVRRFEPQLKIVHTRRVSYPVNFFSRYFKYNIADVHVCVSNEIKELMGQYFPNVHTIHSCVDEKRFTRNDYVNPYENSKDINLLFVGAFSKQKGVEVLIEAFSKIADKYSNIKLNLVGDGPLFDKINMLVSNLKIEKKVNFYGHQKNVEAFYVFSDIVISPSVDGEGSNGVIKEGMVCKKIVIASDIKSNYELITNKLTGVFFRNKDSHDLASKIQRVINREIILDKERIFSRAMEFSCKNNVAAYIKLYKELKQK